MTTSHSGRELQVAVERVGPSSSSDTGIFASANEVIVDGANSFTNVAGNIYNVTQHVQPVHSQSAQPAPPPPTRSPEHESVTYARLLLPKCNGYPLWYPPPRQSLPVEYRRQGIGIGDVGIITAQGRFDFLFNVCLAKDHPINGGRVPDDFEEVIPSLEERDIENVEDGWVKGGCVVGGAVEVLTHPSAIGQEYIFQCHPDEGAILTLPLGGCSQDLLDLVDFRNYAGKHGISWYKYINQRRGREAANGSVYLVTGFDKVTAWGTASYITGLRPRGDVRMSFGVATDSSQSGTVASKYSHIWHQRAGGSAKEGPLVEHHSELEERPQNQCTFIRGFKVALGESIWDSVFGKVEVHPLVGQNPTQILQKSNFIPFGGATGSGLMKLFQYKGGGGPKDEEAESATPTTPRGEQEQAVIVTSLVPKAPNELHPSTAIMHYMLDKNKNAQIAVVHDQVWMSLIQQGETELPEPPVLIERMEALYEFTTSEHAIFVSHKTDQHTGADAVEQHGCEDVETNDSHPTEGNLITEDKSAWNWGSPSTSQGHQPSSPPSLTSLSRSSIADTLKAHPALAHQNSSDDRSAFGRSITSIINSLSVARTSTRESTNPGSLSPAPVFARSSSLEDTDFIAPRRRSPAAPIKHSKSAVQAPLESLSSRNPSRSRARSFSSFPFIKIRQSSSSGGKKLPDTGPIVSPYAVAALVNPEISYTEAPLSETLSTDEEEESDNGWSDDDSVFDPATRMNTQHNAAPQVGGQNAVAPGHVDLNPLEGGQNVVVAPGLYFPATVNSLTARPDGSTKRKKGVKHHRDPLELKTSRPTFQRDRCTIMIEQGDPAAKLKPEANGGKERRRRTYIVASDMSEESRYALEWAIGTVLRDGDELLVVTVNENEAKVDPTSTQQSDRVQKLRSQQERQALSYILVRQTTSLLQQTRLNVTVQCQGWHAKNARHMLLDIVDHYKPQMLIVGSRGLGKLKGILLGSTSHYLIQKCSVPVMVARRGLKHPPRRSTHISTSRKQRVSLAEAAAIDRVVHRVDEDVKSMRDEMDREEATRAEGKVMGSENTAGGGKNLRLGSSSEIGPVETSPLLARNGSSSSDSESVTENESGSTGQRKLNRRQYPWSSTASQRSDTDATLLGDTSQSEGGGILKRPSRQITRNLKKASFLSFQPTPEGDRLPSAT